MSHTVLISVERAWTTSAELCSQQRDRGRMAITRCVPFAAFLFAAADAFTIGVPLRAAAPPRADNVNALFGGGGGEGGGGAPNMMETSESSCQHAQAHRVKHRRTDTIRARTDTHN
jgi:hypothetical protein